MRRQPHAHGIRHIDLTDVKPASSETARRINRDIVLEIIHENQPISRADLARLSGLQRSTVSEIVKQLIGERWIREGAQGLPARGRRPTLLGLNEDLLVIAVDVHPGQATVAMVNPNGRLLARSTVPITRDAKASVRSIIECMSDTKSGFRDESIQGIGMSLPGRIDPGSERLIFAPNLHWPEFDLKGTMERNFKIPVKMENAANACLLAELTFGNLDGYRDVVLVTISEGVGTGVFASGRVVFGHRGMAGEFGHIPLDPAGRRCACGRSGCWEVFASCPAALRLFHELDPDSPAISFRELLDQADRGRPNALQVVKRQAEYIALGLLPIISGLAPSMILVAGEVTFAWRLYGPLIEKIVSAHALAGMTTPRIIPAQESETARLRGAAALVFRGAPVHGRA